MSLYAVPHPYHRSYISIVDDTRTMSRTVAAVDAVDPDHVVVIPLEGPLAGLIITQAISTGLANGRDAGGMSANADSAAIADAYMAIYRRLVAGDIDWFPNGTPQKATGPAGRKFTPSPIN